MLIDVVDYETPDGLKLPAGYFEAPNRPDKAIDAVIMNPGSGGTFYHPTMRQIAAVIREAGYPVLTLSTRGHNLVWRDAAGQRYLGHAFEKIHDAPLDFQGAINWLADKGFSRMALYGHSLGGAKALYYGAHDPDPRIKALLIASAPRWSDKHYSTSARSEDFARNKGKAEELVAKGRGQDVFEVDFPQAGTLMSADTYLDKYAGEEYSFMEWADRITLPLFWLEGEKENIYFPIIGNRKDIFARIKSPVRDSYIIPGADHFYAGQYTDVGNAVVRFLDSLSK
jgi:pimeloyl-ACP methyl ester carboxylesterase